MTPAFRIIEACFHSSATPGRPCASPAGRGSFAADPVGDLQFAARRLGEGGLAHGGGRQRCGGRVRRRRGAGSARGLGASQVVLRLQEKFRGELGVPFLFRYFGLVQGAGGFVKVLEGVFFGRCSGDSGR